MANKKKTTSKPKPKASNRKPEGLLGLGLSDAASKRISKVKDKGTLGATKKDFIIREEAAKTEAAMNRPNIGSAFDTQTWTTDENGNPVLTQTLNAQEQAMLDKRRGVGIAAGDLSNQFLNSGAFNNPLSAMSGEQAANNYFQAGKRKLDPIFAQQNQELEQSLADRGLKPGSEQYDRMMRNQAEQQNAAFLDLQNNAEFQGVNLAGQQLNNESQARNSNLQNMQGLFGLITPTTPEVRDFSRVNMQSPDYLGANTQNSIAGSNLKQNQAQFGQSLAEQQRQFNIARQDQQDALKRSQNNAKNSSRNQLIGAGINAAGQAVGSYLAS